MPTSPSQFDPPVRCLGGLDCQLPVQSPSFRLGGRAKWQGGLCAAPLSSPALSTASPGHSLTCAAWLWSLPLLSGAQGCLVASSMEVLLSAVH